jgi:serine/threonine-protein kinase
MGTVFEARHVRLGHRVAIKVLGAALRDHPDLVKRFEREARAAFALSSPHAARVFDIDTTADGTPFMVMELLSGRDLAKIVTERGPQPIGLAARWVIEASDAIGEAHRLGIIHRDIKPSNLFLCDGGTIKVLDFGLAKRVAAKEEALTAALAPLGTPQYMSPEQVRCAADLDARTDVWSLGVTLYELVTGRTPYDHDIPQACIAAIVIDPVPDPRSLRPDLPSDLARVMMRALEKDREHRFQSVDELAIALEPFADPAPLVHSDSSARSISSGTGDDALARRPSASETRATRAAMEAWRRDVRARPALEHGTRRNRRSASSKTCSPWRARRVRSALAAASAVVLGLVALTVTPRRSEKDARTTVAAAVSTPRAQVSAHAATSAPPARAHDGPPKGEVEGEPASSPTRKPSPPSVARPRPGLRPARPAVRHPDDGSGMARVIGRDRLVHGGLSSPGF